MADAVCLHQVELERDQFQKEVVDEQALKVRVETELQGQLDRASAEVQRLSEKIAKPDVVTQKRLETTEAEVDKLRTLLEESRIAQTAERAEHHAALDKLMLEKHDASATAADTHRIAEREQSERMQEALEQARQSSADRAAHLEAQHRVELDMLNSQHQQELNAVRGRLEHTDSVRRSESDALEVANGVHEQELKKVRAECATQIEVMKSFYEEEISKRSQANVGQEKLVELINKVDNSAQGMQQLQKQLNAQKSQLSTDTSNSLEYKQSSMTAMSSRLDHEQSVLKEQQQAVLSAVALLEQRAAYAQEENSQQSSRSIAEHTRLQAMQATLDAELTLAKQMRTAAEASTKHEREQIQEFSERERLEMAVERESVDAARLQLVRDQKTHERTKHQLEIEYEARERSLEMREVHLEQLEQKVEEDASQSEVLLRQAECDAAKVALEAASLQTEREMLEDRAVHLTELGQTVQKQSEKVAQMRRNTEQMAVNARNQVQQAVELKKSTQGDFARIQHDTHQVEQLRLQQDRVRCRMIECGHEMFECGCGMIEYSCKTVEFGCEVINCGVVASNSDCCAGTAGVGLITGRNARFDNEAAAGVQLAESRSDHRRTIN